MGTTNFILILSAEVIALCLFVIAVLLLKNRKLQRLMGKLQKRMEELLSQVRTTKQPAQPPPPPPPPPPISYSERLDGQLELTKDYHYNLGTRQDIALDLDPDAPLPRRTAALRYAFLIAEKEASADEAAINWDFLATRYQQILAFNEDYSPEDNSHLTADLEQVREDLVQAKKRINNLERFKSLYFDLEEKWDKCKTQANETYTELKSFAEKSEQKEDLEKLLESYHNSYEGLGELIIQGTNEGLNADLNNPDAHLTELRRLRTVAADQHKIISELQEKLSTSNSLEEKTEIVQGLQTELQKQARFLQESETCIQLMEDELANANQEIETLRSRAMQAAQLKQVVKELQSSADTREQIVDSLKQENRRLAKKIKLTQEAPPEDNQEVRGLRKELSSMQSKYNDLEEKFLNLKLKG